MLLAAVSQISLFLAEYQRLQRSLHFGTPFFRTAFGLKGHRSNPQPTHRASQPTLKMSLGDTVTAISSISSRSFSVSQHLKGKSISTYHQDSAEGLKGRSLPLLCCSSRVKALVDLQSVRLRGCGVYLLTLVGM